MPRGTPQTRFKESAAQDSYWKHCKGKLGKGLALEEYTRRAVGLAHEFAKTLENPSAVDVD